MSEPNALVLFDPVGTLGTEVAASRTERLTDFAVYPSAVELVTRLRERARVGVFSLDSAISVDRLREQLGASSLAPALALDLIEVAPPGQERPFQQVLDLDLAPAPVVFVSPDAARRARARDEGLRVAPHPALALDVLDGETLQLARIPGGSEQLAELGEAFHAVPVLQERDAFYFIAGRASVEQVGPSAEVLGTPDFLDDSTLVLLQLPPEQVDASDRLSSFIETLRQEDLPLLEPTASGWLVGLPSDRSFEVLHPPPAGAGHGHTRILSPSFAAAIRPPTPRNVPTRDLSDAETDLLHEFDGTAMESRLKALSDAAAKHGTGEGTGGASS